MLILQNKSNIRIIISVIKNPNFSLFTISIMQRFTWIIVIFTFDSSLDFIWNTSLAALGALANRLQRRTARKANEANLDPPNQKSEITSL